MELIDSHAHLTCRELSDLHTEVLQRAHEAGIKTIINIGSGEEMAGNFKVLKMSEEKIGGCRVYPTCGVHPHDAKILDRENQIALEELFRKNKNIVAVGEAGLDFHYNFSDPEKQKQAFIFQVELAIEYSLPLIVHSREAWSETMDILRRFRNKLGAIIVHCFGGNDHKAEDLLEMDAYIGINGIITFKTAERLRQIVSDYPLSRVILETDCPYLAPVPFRGKTNEPSYLVHTARKVAEITGNSLETIAKITSDNVYRVFALAG